MLKTSKDDKYLKALSLNVETPNEMKNEEEKMFGILKVRPIGVTKTNVITMYTLEYTGMLAIMWWGVYKVFYLQD